MRVLGILLITLWWMIGLSFRETPLLQTGNLIKLSRYGRSQSILRSTSVVQSQDNTKQAMLYYFNQNPSASNIYACPESLEPLELARRQYGWTVERFFLDRRFGARYPINPYYINFLANWRGGLLTGETPSARLGQLFFQNPLVSFFYERGYRQNFALYGFPGIEKEYEEAERYFLDNNATSLLLDLSCGSGFMTRRFLQSKRFDRVIAADLSPTMLLETYRNCRQEGIEPPELLRCDSSKLPFRSNSLDAIHAGAAMHCWPEISRSLSEIYRVLKPGGVYFATTIKQANDSGVSPRLVNQQGFTFFPSLEAVEQLLKQAGFEGAGGVLQEVRLEGSRCFVIKAKKLQSSEVITIPISNH